MSVTIASSSEGGHLAALLCDLGNVVFYFDRRRSYDLAARLSGRPVARIQRIVEASDLPTRYEQGELTDGQFLAEIATLLALPAGPDMYGQLAQAWSDMFRLNLPMAKTLATLKRAGVRLVILSNTNPLHFKHLEKEFASTMSLFDDKVLSYQVGAMKPAAAIFQHALQTVRCLGSPTPIKYSLYIDDLKENVEAAQALGIQSHLYSRHTGFVNWLKRMLPALSGLSADGNRG